MKRFVRAALTAALAVALVAPTIYAERVVLVEGWTGDLEFVLKADGTAVDVTGMTVELLLYKSDGTLVDTDSDITLSDPTNGEVTYAPDATDLDADDSPLRSRFKVTDGLGKIVYFPNGDMDVWIVANP